MKNSYDKINVLAISIIVFAFILMSVLYFFQKTQLEENIRKSGYSILNALVTDTRHSLQKGERNVFQGVLDKIGNLENVKYVALYTPDTLMTYKSNEMSVGLPFLKQGDKLINPNEELYIKTNGSYLRDDWTFSKNNMGNHDKFPKKYKYFENIKSKDCSACHVMMPKNLSYDHAGKTHIINKKESQFFYDIPVQKECIECHTHWKIGQSAGYLNVVMDNQNLTNQANNRLKYFFLILLGVIFSFLLIIYFIKTLNNRLRKTQVKLKEQVTHDPMTQLYNRRYLYEVAPKIIQRCQNKNSELSLLMFDIDNFKKINDTYGHDVGDKVIITLAKEVLKTIRNSDIPVRFGGEEFLILLPEVTIINAKMIAEKIRANIEALEVENIKFTVSIGLTSYDFKKDEKIDDTIKRADLALYDAKESGKNRVCLK